MIQPASLPFFLGHHEKPKRKRSRVKRGKVRHDHTVAMASAGGRASEPTYHFVFGFFTRPQKKKNKTNYLASSNPHPPHSRAYDRLQFLRILETSSNNYLHMAWPIMAARHSGYASAEATASPRTAEHIAAGHKNRLFMAAMRKSVQPPKSALCAQVKSTECYKHIFTLWLATSGSCKSWQRAPCNSSSGHAWLVIIWILCPTQQEERCEVRSQSLVRRASAQRPSLH